MRKLLPTLLATALLGAGALAAASAAVAADANGTAADRAAARDAARQRFFDKIDTNHDGVVSRAEYQAWVDARFAKLDPQGTGSVDAAQIAASPAAAARVQKRAEAFVKRYDTSGSGSVSKADFEAREMARFDRLSGGADTLTPDQLAAARHGRHGHGAPAATTSSGG